ncbi:AmmeMemoRadiSam system radical SAM enzyme [Candidatus Micrarchaeota archaeon]|nr:AmmeMemoRadiSam system radical SAM enzyme [Candidatus Micrarchaeota archaeon]MBU1165573.1 AmmeMemoRadiSam system radical SAM enzyme [Candidatus Micrarchaeota archaeon]MBU1887384.1 AmmeMemoRadiSam system radical SAM enzyme [Candidatus Micrarchaeota archaeon]
MKLFKELENKKIQCIACNRRCVISPGDAGFCGVRANENSKLKLTVYGKPCAVWIDPIEKKPLFHFLPGTKSFSIGTFGCNFSCDFCQNYDISQAPQDARMQNPKGWKGYFEELVGRCNSLPPEIAVQAALHNGCKSISFTYNEPTIFTEYALDVMEIAKPRGLKGIYVTNGYETIECWDTIKGKIDAANIDLKAYNQKFYTKLCKVPDFRHVKESIEYAKKIGIWVEVTTLLIPGWNDKENELKQEAEYLASVDPEMPWHITAFHPDYKMTDGKRTPPETLVRVREIGFEAGLKHVYCGNLLGKYAEYENTICPKCGKKIIQRSGFEVLEASIVDGRCRHCKNNIRGVWK